MSGISGLGLAYYVVFKTSLPDGSAFFGIQQTTNPTFGSDGHPWTYLGKGPKLAAKARQFGIHRLRPEVIQLYATYEEARRKLDTILTPATLADPLCLNMPPSHGPEHGARVSEGLTGKSKSITHRLAISEAMVSNDNALGHVKSDEAKALISETKLSNSTSKLKWYHNKSTGEQIQLEEDEDCLTGFELGKLPKEFAKNFKKVDQKVLSDAERARILPD
jgi:hypothetical protein